MTPRWQDFQLALEALNRRNIGTAIDLLDRAERSGYEPDECAAQRWRCWMLSGQFNEAWQESDQIGRRGGPDPYRLWDGQPFTNNRVIIRCLHGFGDAIQFVRYAALVRRQAARVTVQTHPELVSLMRGMASADNVISWAEEDRNEWDQQIEVMELPYAFRTTLETIPCDIPYLTVDAEYTTSSRVSHWPGDRPRVGLQWGAGEWDTQRSIPLRCLQPICQSPDLEYYSFQRGRHRLELRDFEAVDRIYDVSGSSPEIVEAAADLLNIDLLISVDTMLAHLAGALGKPVWVLLPWDSDWRWMVNRRDTPWYPTMRLFRQSSPGDWDSAVQQMKVELYQTFAHGKTLAEA